MKVKEIYIVRVDTSYADSYESIGFDILGAYVSEEKAIDKMNEYIKRIINHLDTLDPETDGYYRFEDCGTHVKTLSYWDWERYDTNIDITISVYGIDLDEES